jgi:UDP-N-acetylglucosamine--N-acetylmuramyl-(pentapeptide) pyrophosphoryl-undecaprenol N-acetylglucosamine transferase
MTAPRTLPIVIAAGGTGGHVFPAEALAAELIARGAAPVLFTDRRGDSYGGVLGTLEVRQIRGGGLAGVGTWARVRSVLALSAGYLEARTALKRVAPAAVIGFGGYASVPTLMAASLLGHPTMIHEQNAVLGRANRLLAPRVERIATVFDQVARLPEGTGHKVVRTGMPVRAAFSPVRDRAYAPPLAGLPIRLLVLGGSQGAQVFSHVIPEAVARLPLALRQRLNIVQQCRPEDLDHVRDHYGRQGVRADLATFFTDVPERLGQTHLMVARAGASTVGEITLAGRPAILVPYPHAIDDHQSANAKAIETAGAGWVMPQDTFTAEALARRIEALLAEPEALVAAASAARALGAPEAAARLADAVFDLVHARRRQNPATGSRWSIA